MPTYDFRCTKCNHEFAENVPIKDKDKVKCPKCGGEVKQLFTFAGFSVGGGSSSGSCNSGGG